MKLTLENLSHKHQNQRPVNQLMC